MSEYLKGFTTPFVESVNVSDILEKGEVIDARALREFLIEARRFLITEPGPNLARRQEYEPEWISWWINYLGLFEREGQNDFVPSEKFTRLEKIADVLRSNNLTSGVLFMGGGEGHEGHRHAVDWMGEKVSKKILLFDQEINWTSKERGVSFLPLSVRISMWNYHLGVDFISIMPLRDTDTDLSEHYGEVFRIVRADYCFATEGDPFADEKRRRGRQASFTLIPKLDVLSTTMRVKKLFP